MPTGQIHMDVGLQTTSDTALKAIQRPALTKGTWEGLRFLCGLENVQVHVDLLAGLPHVSMKGIYHDVAALIQLKPQEIQLELLKLLPGTPLRNRAGEHGLIFAPDPPYEVLATQTMGTGDLNEARLLSHMIDQFYNAHQLQPVIARGVSIDGPRFLREFLTFLKARGKADHPLSMRNRFTTLADHLSLRLQAHDATLQILQYEWLRNGLTPRDRFCPAARETEGVPRHAVHIDGADDARTESGQLWHARIGDRAFWFAFPDPTGGQPASAIFKVDAS